MSDSLFDANEFEDWRNHWVDMPSFSVADQRPTSSIVVNFASHTDRREFLASHGYSEGRQASIWVPAQHKPKVVRDAEAVTVERNKYPVYIISKGRWDNPLTAKALDALGINYRMVVEPQEANRYAEVVGQHKIIETPFSNLGQGSIPARNFVWQHATNAGHERHWLLDDNIRRFYRLNENRILPVVDENPFVSMERFVDRYANVPMAGPQYLQYADQRTRQPAFRTNTRVYSCTLLGNSTSHRWRGRYNEDTDLSLRILKDGDCTVIFNHYLIDKTTTMTMTGGNTDELYRQDGEFDGRLAMAESLVEQHPDVAGIVWKWGRWQHVVDYGKFKGNKLRRVNEHATSAA